MTLRRFFTRARRPVPPTEADVQRADAYRSWASSKGLTLDENDGLRVRGVLHGRRVEVDPRCGTGGVTSGAVDAVRVLVDVALPGCAAIALTRARRGAGALDRSLGSLFDDERVGPSLQAMHVTRQTVALTFDPGAPPSVVDDAVRALAATLRSLYVAPRRSSTSSRPAAPPL